MSTVVFLAIKAANPLIMCSSDHVFVWLSNSQDHKWLTHRWRSFPGLVLERVTILFAYTNRQYNHFGRMLLCSCLFAKNVRLKIIDALLTLTLMTYWQSVGAQQLYVKMHIVVIGSEYIVSMYKHLHQILPSLSIFDSPLDTLSEW